MGKPIRQSAVSSRWSVVGGQEAGGSGWQCQSSFIVHRFVGGLLG
jgi:hypothetical protein